MAIGTSFQTAAGFMNFGTNLFYRITSDDNTIPMLITGLATGNPVTAGTAAG